MWQCSCAHVPEQYTFFGISVKILGLVAFRFPDAEMQRNANCRHDHCVLQLVHRKSERRVTVWIAQWALCSKHHWPSFLKTPGEGKQ